MRGRIIMFLLFMMCSTIHVVSPFDPTSQPSGQPSAFPTGYPTSQPTMQPSSKPTAKPSSSTPSAQPSGRPSGNPSSQPSAQPMIYPTALPTAQPSVQPSSNPTAQPSSVPSFQPSAKPSTQPTALPTAQPSIRPSSEPTAQPTIVPSSQPSAKPSTQPIALPTAQPSVWPSSEPTTQPSNNPSSQPSSQPIMHPTALPTTQPSLQPRAEPTANPTNTPSSQPSSKPSIQPSSQPSTSPSVMPTSQPSTAPSRQPISSPTSQPSGQPSAPPTSQPSAQPVCLPSIYPTGQPTNGPTSSPSASPSNQPSSTPSNSPTSQPSVQPFAMPTSQPSGQPTRSPTSHPSSQPTNQPSEKPSVAPSSQPSVSPSSQPSAIPSNQPSIQPTLSPSNRPSATPSGQPTIHPTSSPSGQPSISPTSQPSLEPSSQPSSTPSTQPSACPTVTPSMQPSVSPTNQPSSQPSSSPTVIPTSQPSMQPSNSPTEQPSQQPSAVPTVIPSGIPTSQPSNQPTGLPTIQPSVSPSAQPSSLPSCQPSVRPTSQPSTSPTTAPSSFPSSQPSTQPSNKPSTTPSAQPSTSPTMQPSTSPSDQPSVQPSALPTTCPSSGPTTQPTIQPSISPTSQPSMQPSVSPTHCPTSQPSTQPTVCPSAQPSGNPSAQPSRQPTSQPIASPTGQPTGSPTMKPTTQPSSVPTAPPSRQPSASPTMQPSTLPTVQPSGIPTTIPSVNPSSQPSLVPTAQPSRNPSSQPSAQPSGGPTSLPTSQPSAQPSINPSSYPTARPTTRSSGQPTSQPTAQPSSSPTGQPSIQPTTQPTRQPTAHPTSQPSHRPTSQPTSVPTSHPSTQPSSSPSADPTTQPSNQPSCQPSVSPSKQPTTQPTGSPSSEPSTAPTSQPSCHPSSLPTRQPTSIPTEQPTSMPSARPSGQPSKEPSGKPTSEPSRQPSSAPSRQPTERPTSQPTGIPSGIPSSQPSVGPSGQPSVAPSTYPSAQPTASPSSQPSSHPSDQPSVQPTMSPTQQPTSQPSGIPSQQPSAKPSAQPSSQPSMQPSSSPSSQPSRLPSSQPTAIPTAQPSRQPTGKPSCQPTTRPSMQPSRQPSSQPSLQPTSKPSNIPTSQPTRQPSGQPSGKPSSQPSVQPTVSPTNQPSSQPSRQPSGQPSCHPSRQPTRQPSGQPSSFPTTQPTRQPTAQPSRRPSTQPSIQPTVQPTSQPSSRPSRQPSSQPSRQPSCSPSRQPTNQPSVQPTMKPSRQPSTQPSAQPSIQPTSLPTKQPTAKPSGQPTRQPSSQPTRQPSSHPTRQPSSQPSIHPTNQPTAIPSGRPSTQPSTTPTIQPSVQPSAQPSFQPSNRPSRQPTSQPTLQPSQQPSAQPTCQPTCQPTRQPTRQPTSQPSHMPSAQPTRQPTRQPTSQPSRRPTTQPTRQPTRQPTGQPSRIPTSQPSGQPTSQPSFQPSRQPTSQPSKQPTRQPSAKPSTQPTSHPSIVVSTRYPNITSIDILEVNKTSVDIFILFSEKLTAIVYCGVFEISSTQNSTWRPSSQQDIAVLMRQNQKAFVRGRSVYMTLSGLIPATNYNAFCMTTSADGIAIMPIPTIVRSRFQFITACCKQILVNIRRSVVMANELVPDVVSVTFVESPSSSLRIFPGFTPLNNNSSKLQSARIQAFPNVFRLPAGAITKSTTFSVHGGDVAAKYLLSLDVVAASATTKSSSSSVKEFEIVYVDDRRVIKVINSTANLIPTATEARFNSDGSQVTVTFSMPTNRAGYVNSFPCSQIFNFTGILYASCAWSDDRTVSITQPGIATLPANAPLMIGTNIQVVKGNNILSFCSGDCSGRNEVPSTTLKVLAPASAVRPTVDIAGPTIISSCANLVFDIFQSTGNGGRAWDSHRFSVLDSASYQIHELQSFLNSANYSLLPPTPIPERLLQKNRVYTFTLTLCNFLGGCGTQTHAVTIQSIEWSTTLSVQIVGSSQRSLTPKSVLNIRSAVSIQRCATSASIDDGVSNKDILYSWKMYRANGSEFILNVAQQARNPATYRLPAYSLVNVGEEYDLEVSVSVPSHPEVQPSSARVHLTVTSDSLEAILQTTSKMITPRETIKLDASRSQDLNRVSASRGLAADLQFFWSCVQVAPSFNASFCPFRVNQVNFVGLRKYDYLTATPRSYLSQLLATGSSVTARFYLTVSKDVRSSSTYIDVAIVGEIPSQTTASLSLAFASIAQGLSAEHFDVNQKLILQGNIQAITSCLSSWKVDDPTLSLRNASLATSLETSVIVGPGVSMSSQSVYLTLSSNALPSGAKLTFSLFCTPFESVAIDGNPLAAITIVTNSAPTPGPFFVNPVSGVEILTKFSFSALLWNDADIPLTYVFGYNSPTLGIPIYFQSQSESSSASTVLPAGLDYKGFNVSVFVNVFDSLNSMATASRLIEVTPVNETVQISFVNENLELDITNIDHTRAVLSVSSKVLNAVNCTMPVAINCTALRRDPCLATAFTCGPCWRGYIGENGDANSQCLSTKEYHKVSKPSTKSAAWISQEDDIVGQNEDLILKNLTMRSLAATEMPSDLTDIRCRQDSDCGSSNVQFPWIYCVLKYRRCRYLTKSCESDCSGNGNCTYYKTITGNEVSTCRIDDLSCAPRCRCLNGFYGTSCQYTTEQWYDRQQTRSLALSVLYNMTRVDDVNTHSLSSWSQLIYSLTINPYEMSSLNSLNTVNLAKEILEMASNSSIETASSSTTYDVLKLSYAAKSIDNLANLPKFQDVVQVVDDFTYSPQVWYETHYYNNSDAQSEGLVSVYDTWASLLRAQIVPGENSSTIIDDNARLLLFPAVLDDFHSDIVFTSPLSTVEELTGKSIAHFNVSRATKPTVLEPMNILVTMTEFSTRSFQRKGSIHSNVYALQLEVDGGAEITILSSLFPSNYKLIPTSAFSNNEYLGQVVGTIQVEIPHNEGEYIPSFEDDFIVNEFVTWCEGESDFSSHHYRCPDSGYEMTHNCSGLRGTFVSYCLKPVPICSAIEYSSGGTDEEIVRPLTSLCATERFTVNKTTCSCNISSSIPSLSYTVVTDDDLTFRHLSNEGIEYLLDSNHNRVMFAISTGYTLYRRGDFFVGSPPSLGPSPAWVPGTLSIPFLILFAYFCLRYRSFYRKFKEKQESKRKVQDSNTAELGIDKEKNTQIAKDLSVGLPSTTPSTPLPMTATSEGRTPSALSIWPWMNGLIHRAGTTDQTERDKTPAQQEFSINTPEEFCTMYISFFDSLLPRIYSTDSLWSRIKHELSKHYKYLPLGATNAQDFSLDMMTFRRVIRAFTVFSCMLFVLTMSLISYSGRDDGSCEAQLTQSTCLMERSYFDNQVHICSWEKVRYSRRYIRETEIDKNIIEYHCVYARAELSPYAMIVASCLAVFFSTCMGIFVDIITDLFDARLVPKINSNDFLQQESGDGKKTKGDNMSAFDGMFPIIDDNISDSDRETGSPKKESPTKESNHAGDRATPLAPGLSASSRAIITRQKSRRERRMASKSGGFSSSRDLVSKKQASGVVPSQPVTLPPSVTLRPKEFRIIPFEIRTARHELHRFVKHFFKIELTNVLSGLRDLPPSAIISRALSSRSSSRWMATKEDIRAMTPNSQQRMGSSQSASRVVPLSFPHPLQEKQTEKSLIEQVIDVRIILESLLNRIHHQRQLMPGHNHHHRLFTASQIHEVENFVQEFDFVWGISSYFTNHNDKERSNEMIVSGTSTPTVRKVFVISPEKQQLIEKLLQQTNDFSTKKLSALKLTPHYQIHAAVEVLHQSMMDLMAGGNQCSLSKAPAATIFDRKFSETFKVAKPIWKRWLQLGILFIMIFNLFAICYSISRISTNKHYDWRRKLFVCFVMLMILECFVFAVLNVISLHVILPLLAYHQVRFAFDRLRKFTLVSLEDIFQSQALAAARAFGGDRFTNPAMMMNFSAFVPFNSMEQMFSSHRLIKRIPDLFESCFLSRYHDSIPPQLLLISRAEQRKGKKSNCGSLLSSCKSLMLRTNQTEDDKEEARQTSQLESITVIPHDTENRTREERERERSDSVSSTSSQEDNLHTRPAESTSAKTTQSNRAGASVGAASNARRYSQMVIHAFASRDRDLESHRRREAERGEDSIDERIQVDDDEMDDGGLFTQDILIVLDCLIYCFILLPLRALQTIDNTLRILSVSIYEILLSFAAWCPYRWLKILLDLFSPVLLISIALSIFYYLHSGMWIYKLYLELLITLTLFTFSLGVYSYLRGFVTSQSIELPLPASALTVVESGSKLHTGAIAGPMFTAKALSLSPPSTCPHVTGQSYFSMKDVGRLVEIFNECLQEEMVHREKELDKERLKEMQKELEPQKEHERSSEQREVTEELPNLADYYPGNTHYQQYGSEGSSDLEDEIFQVEDANMIFPLPPEQDESDIDVSEFETSTIPVEEPQLLQVQNETVIHSPTSSSSSSRPPSPASDLPASTSIMTRNQSVSSPFGRRRLSTLSPNRRVEPSFINNQSTEQGESQGQEPERARSRGREGGEGGGGSDSISGIRPTRYSRATIRRSSLMKPSSTVVITPLGGTQNRVSKINPPSSSRQTLSRERNASVMRPSDMLMMDFEEETSDEEDKQKQNNDDSKEKEKESVDVPTTEERANEVKEKLEVVEEAFMGEIQNDKVTKVLPAFGSRFSTVPSRERPSFALPRGTVLNTKSEGSSVKEDTDTSTQKERELEDDVMTSASVKDNPPLRTIARGTSRGTILRRASTLQSRQSSIVLSRANSSTGESLSLSGSLSRTPSVSTTQADTEASPTDSTSPAAPLSAASTPGNRRASVASLVARRSSILRGNVGPVRSTISTTSTGITPVSNVKERVGSSEKRFRRPTEIKETNENEEDDSDGDGVVEKPNDARDFDSIMVKSNNNDDQPRGRIDVDTNALLPKRSTVVAPTNVARPSIASISRPLVALPPIVSVSNANRATKIGPRNSMVERRQTSMLSKQLETTQNNGEETKSEGIDKTEERDEASNKNDNVVVDINESKSRSQDSADIVEDEEIEEDEDEMDDDDDDDEDLLNFNFSAYPATSKATTTSSSNTIGTSKSNVTAILNARRLKREQQQKQ